jgi:hypothetical protein
MKDDVRPEFGGAYCFLRKFREIVGGLKRQAVVNLKRHVDEDVGP